MFVKQQSYRIAFLSATAIGLLIFGRFWLRRKWLQAAPRRHKAEFRVCRDMPKKVYIVVNFPVTFQWAYVPMRRYLDCCPWAFQTWLPAKYLHSPHNPPKDSIDGRSERYTATDGLSTGRAWPLVVSSNCTGQPTTRPAKKPTKRRNNQEVKEFPVLIVVPGVAIQRTSATHG